MVLRVIDVETTGTDPTKDRIVEIASVDLIRLPDGGFDIANERDELVNPGVPIPPQASAVHHIIDHDVAQAPRIEDVIDIFRGADAYVAHNSAFDMAFLEPHLGPQVWGCSYKAALRLWPDAPGHSNQVLRYWRGLRSPFGRPRDDFSPHRALSDVIVTAAIFVELSNSAKWSEILKWSSEPALHTSFAFGKHRGQRFDAVDPDYLRWIIDKSDLDAGIKFSAAYWLRSKEAA